MKEQDAEWGYEPGRGGMAVEAKMGMCIVAILLCAFSFLVYHKYDLKQKALAFANGAGGDTTAAGPETEEFEPSPARDLLAAREEYRCCRHRQPPADDS